MKDLPIEFLSRKSIAGELVRLLTGIRDPLLQPMAFRHCLLQQRLPAVLSPDKSGFRDEASFRLLVQIPKDLTRFQIAPGRSLSLSEAL
jgi:hypothetical protein